MKKKTFIVLSLTAILSLSMVSVSMAEDLINFLTGGSTFIDLINRETESNAPAPKILTLGDYSYWINDADSSAVIAEYTGSDDVIEIPAELNGHPVSYIGPQAFTYLEMKELNIPDGIVSIENRAFEYCTISGSLKLPEGIVISENAFAYATLPVDVKIPASTVIKENAFSYCMGLKHIFIGPDASVEGRAFEYCDDLEMVICANGSRLEPGAFGYCDALGKVILCGDVELTQDSFNNCAAIYMTEAEESDYETWLQPDQGQNTTSPQAETEPVAGGSSTQTPETEPVPGGSSTQIPETDPEPTQEPPLEHAPEMLSGGWETTRNNYISKSDQDVFDRAMTDHDRIDYEAAALLATQVVAGTNYCFLCRTSVIGSSENPTYQLVYIYQDLQDNVQVLKVQDIHFGLTGAENKTDPETEVLSDDEHRILLTGDTDVFYECPLTAKTGELVTVYTADVCDGVVTVTVNGSDTGSWKNGGYTFVMPDSDVELNGGISTAGYPGA